jgi:nicotinamide/nicotinate riboside kinase
VLLRAPHDVLRQRRHEREYHYIGEHPLIKTLPKITNVLPLGVRPDPEVRIWRDPPYYWGQITWPAYVEAHKHVFENGNWESGASSDNIEDLMIIDELEIGMTHAVNEVCEKLKRVAYPN